MGCIPWLQIIGIVCIAWKFVEAIKVHHIGARIVQTKHGPVKGKIVTMDYRLQFRNIEQYLGVPYASPPVDNLRFMPPVTSAPWKEVKPVEDLKPVCPQMLPSVHSLQKIVPYGRVAYLNRILAQLHNQSEDCLYLNIYLRAGGRCLNKIFL